VPQARSESLKFYPFKGLRRKPEKNRPKPKAWAESTLVGGGDIGRMPKCIRWRKYEHGFAAAQGKKGRRNSAILLKAGMKSTVRWVEGGMVFVGETGSGHLVTMDGAPEGGGRNLAPRPMELVLAGTGGCAAYDVVLILRRGRHDLVACEVDLIAERAATEPKVFTRIDMRFKVRGRALSRTAVERAVKLSHDKYCSATAMLAHTAEISYSIEIEEA
jgi:putative redox protein